MSGRRRSSREILRAAGQLLLDQAAGETTPLRDTVNGAIAYVESFAAQP